MRRIIICDLDGTLADGSHREYLIKTVPRQWDAYFSLCHMDVPVWNTVELITSLSRTYRIVILTGRIESTREKTTNWLHEFDIPFHQLIMRPTEDRTDDDILKLRQAANHGFRPENVVAILEDRNRVVKAWRQAGYQCFQVRDGDF